MQLLFDTANKNGSAVVFREDKKTSVDIAGKKAIHFGIGKYKDLTRLACIRAFSRLIRLAKDHEIDELRLNYKDLALVASGIETDPSALGRLFGEVLPIADYDFATYRSEKKDKPHHVKRVVFLRVPDAFKKGVKQGQIAGEHANIARAWANTPSQDLSPLQFAEEVRELFLRKDEVKVKVLTLADLEAEKMGLVIGVGKGSHNEPCLIEAKYEGNPTSNDWIALVGKGVCFDSGGHDIKTGGHMLGMHKDMSGGAAVIVAISALAEMKLKVNAVAIVPAVENMVSSHSYKPGDILTSMSGKTVEIGNTDAEGRLILADGLTYAQQKYSLSHLFEASTLTGAVSVAVGEKYSGTFTMHDDLAKLFEIHGKLCGEEVWRLPVSEDFLAELKKNSHADIANIPLNDTRWGRASHAAAFLHAFVDHKKIPFMHIDIASRMDATAEDNLAHGATGVPVRLLLRVIEHISKS